MQRIEDALALARRDGRPAVASATQPIDPALDVSAAVLSSRGAGDRFFCMEQPGLDGHVVCGLGTCSLLAADGADRFERVVAAGRELSSRTLADDPAADSHAPPGSGPVHVGGFAFAHAGGRSPEWLGFDPAQLVLPEVSFARRREEARMTVAVAVDGDESPEALMERVTDRLESLRVGEIPLVDPDPVARPRVAGAAPPAHYEEAVRRAVERIRAGELEKVVLAREVRVIGRADIDPAPVFDGLRAAFAECYCYCVGAAEGVLVGASPELLVRRDGARGADGGAGGHHPPQRRSRPWTTTSASSCFRARRTGSSRPSCRSASSARSTR